MSTKAQIKRRLPLFIGCLISVAFFVIGFWDRRVVLNNNPCKMTYTSKEKSPLKISGKQTLYKLWKISNPSSKKLNVQPVLFIPGHLGSVDQVRSLASTMHNGDNFFQYYSLDFQEEPTAFHGSDILAQASFVNEALHKIGKIYNISSTGATQDGLKIILVGHSLGGMVARTAVILSNHPHCIVRDVILLSSPNIKAPYAPDSSMDVLFSAVNKAWLLSFYNSSKACHTSSVMASLSSRSLDRSAALSADYTCPVCAPHVRLISISGGELDLQVAPELTLLNNLASRPRNTSLEKPKQQVNLGVNIGVLGRMNQLTMFVPRLVSRASIATASFVSRWVFPKAPSNGSASSSTTSGSVGEEHQQCESSDANVCISPLTTEQLVPSTEGSTDATAAITNQRRSGKGQFSSVTRESWDKDILPYIEPQYLSARTSQLQGVGFPIDHTAVLWCHQLVGVVSRGMKALATAPDTSLPDLAQIFSVQQPLSSAIHEVEDLGIDQLTSFVQRNASAVAFREAEASELLYIRTVLAGSQVRTAAVVFVTRHSVKVAVCYLIVSCCALAVFVLRALSGHKSSSEVVGVLPVVTSWSLLQPWTHLSLDLLHPAFVNSLQLVLPAPLIPATLALIVRCAAVAVATKALFDWQFSATFVTTYSTVVYWLVAYFVAISLRAALLTVIYALRFVSDSVYGALRLVLRVTVWNKFVRRHARNAMKVCYAATTRVPLLGTVVLSLERSSALLVPTFIWAVVYMRTRDRIAGPLIALGTTLYGLSIISVVAFVCVCGGVLSSVLFAPFQHSKDRNLYHFHTELTLLYLPVPLLAWPSFLFSAKLLFGPASSLTAASSLFGIFGPERIHYCLAVILIAWHLWVMRAKENMVDNVTEVQWVEELFGVQAVVAAGKVNPNNSTTGLFSAFALSGIRSSSADCIHEDGGERAIFEKIEPSSADDETAVEVAKNVLFGPTYRVVHCDCAKNPKLKFQSEWCQWCLCRKCGGKHLPKEKSYASYSNPDGKDFSVDLIVVAGLIGVAVLSGMYLFEKPFLYLYFVGLVATAHIIALVAKWLKFSA